MYVCMHNIDVPGNDDRDVVIAAASIVVLVLVDIHDGIDVTVVDVFVDDVDDLILLLLSGVGM